MSINALLDEFKVKAATPKQQLEEYKAQGKKVIGVLPYFAPDELVYAAGMVPMGIWGSNTKTISRAKEYCATFYCTIAQLALEMLLDGTMDQLGRHHHADHLRYAAPDEPELPRFHGRQDGGYLPGSSAEPLRGLRASVLRGSVQSRKGRAWRRLPATRSQTTISRTPSRCTTRAVRPAVNS